MLKALVIERICCLKISPKMLDFWHKNNLFDTKCLLACLKNAYLIVNDKVDKNR